MRLVRDFRIPGDHSFLFMYYGKHGRKRLQTNFLDELSLIKIPSGHYYVGKDTRNSERPIFSQVSGIRRIYVNEYYISTHIVSSEQILGMGRSIMAELLSDDVELGHSGSEGISVEKELRLTHACASYFLLAFGLRLPTEVEWEISATRVKKMAESLNIDTYLKSERFERCDNGIVSVDGLFIEDNKFDWCLDFYDPFWYYSMPSSNPCLFHGGVLRGSDEFSIRGFQPASGISSILNRRGARRSECDVTFRCAISAESLHGLPTFARNQLLSRVIA